MPQLVDNLKPYTFERIPDYFRARPQWVCWKYETKPGATKPTKVPYRTNGQLASSTDAESWTSFPLSALAYTAKGFDGVGYMARSDEELVMFDLDHVIDVDELNPIAADLVKSLDSYTELSPSRLGVHVYAFGSKPGNRCKATLAKGTVNEFNVEVYDAERYLTFTGWHWNGTPSTVEHREQQITDVYHRVFAPEPRPKTRELMGTRGTTPTFTDAQVIERCRAARNAERFTALYDRGESGGDASTSDMALIGHLKFWTQDAEQLDRLMRGSKLAREKYDDPRPGGTYLTYSIERALQNVSEVYTTRSAPALTVDVEDALGNRADGLQLVNLGKIEPRPVTWLWPGYIASGALTLLVGDPDQGKSTLLLDLAAHVTTGRAWPDGAAGIEPASVMLLSSEDSTSQTIVPRLLAAGADLSRAHQIKSQVVADGQDRHLSLAHELPELDALYTRQPFRVLIIDPVDAYLPREDTNRSNDVRTILTPLVEWAETRDVAVLGMLHMGKQTDRTVLQRVLGSTAFTAAARACYVACRDAQDENRRYFLCSKMNIAPKPAGLAFRFESCTVRDVSTVRIGWELGAVKLTADQAVRALLKTQPQARGDARRFLIELLAKGPVSAEDGEAQAEDVDIALRTLDRARQDLGVQAVKVGTSLSDARWYWMPPSWGLKEIAAWKLDLGRRTPPTTPVDTQSGVLREPLSRN